MVNSQKRKWIHNKSISLWLYFDLTFLFAKWIQRLISDIALNRLFVAINQNKSLSSWLYYGSTIWFMNSLWLYSVWLFMNSRIQYLPLFVANTWINYLFRRFTKKSLSLLYIFKLSRTPPSSSWIHDESTIYSENSLWIQFFHEFI